MFQSPKLSASCKLFTVSAFGIMVSESIGSGAGDEVTLTIADAEAALPSAFVHTAVTVHWPGLTPATSPIELTEATVGTLEVHLIPRSTGQAGHIQREAGCARSSSAMN